MVTSHGHTAIASSVMRMLRDHDVTYRLRPTGGWHSPTSMLTSITMPKWIEIDAELVRGRKQESAP